MQDTKASIFTREELERWIEKMGGIGAEIVIPNQIYADKGKEALAKLVMGRTATIAGVWTQNNVSVVVFNAKKHGIKYEGHLIDTIGIVWPDMRMKNYAPVITYPHKCKRCKSSARICGKVILCSNIKCKSRKQFKKFVKRFPEVESGTFDNPIVLLCPICNENIIQTYPAWIFADDKIAPAVYCKEHKAQPYDFILNKFYKISGYSLPISFKQRSNGALYFA